MELNQRTRKNLVGVNEKMIQLLEEAIKECPVEFTVTDGFRTLEQQKAIYAKGRTAPGAIVSQMDGVTKRSKHQDGLAVDLYASPGGKVNFDVKQLKECIDWILKTSQEIGIPIDAGMYWKNFKDNPHIELK